MERVLDYITMSMVNDIAFLPLDIYSIVEKPKSKRGNPYLGKASEIRKEYNATHKRKMSLARSIQLARAFNPQSN
jgi:hypothetical protein